MVIMTHEKGDYCRLQRPFKLQFVVTQELGIIPFADDGEFFLCLIIDLCPRNSAKKDENRSTKQEISEIISFHYLCLHR